MLPRFWNCESKNTENRQTFTGDFYPWLPIKFQAEMVMRKKASKRQYLDGFTA